MLGYHQEVKRKVNRLKIKQPGTGGQERCPSQGVTIRQLARITGISKSVIDRI